MCFSHHLPCCMSSSCFISLSELIVLQIVRVLKVLEKPYSDPETLFGPDGCGEMEHSGAELDVAYDGKPPAWAQTVCVT